VADAAVLCPSFFRTDVVSNPTAFEARFDRIWRRLIGGLQRWRAGRRVTFEQEAA
jgi:indolepyruvate ferredoxin oxidoreductase alpha subunit